MDTGRLKATLGESTRKVVYGEPRPEEITRELTLTTLIDLAHVVMLTDRDLLDRGTAAALLSEIVRLRETGFRDLHGVSMPRGLYLAYENHLIDRLGPQVGGRLHMGRSRNDLNATATALRLRGESMVLLREAVRLNAVLLSRARAHRETVMPIHTHFQAAMPITYGHYLLGVAFALGRDIGAMRTAVEDLGRSPLGAGAVAGTDLPIDQALTARLLGFERAVEHAVDAVASRDAVLRILAAAGGAGITLSRLAMDLQLWSTAEFDLVVFPEHLVGSSSAMPQKRNAFLLEHVKAKAGTALGAWAAVASMIKSTPFTNSIEVGTEAVSAVWPGLHAVRDSVRLAQVLVNGARPRPERMVERASRSFVSATAAANLLVREGIAFRTAHHAVGAAVRDVVERGGTELAEVVAEQGGRRVAVRVPDPVTAAATHEYGGGPGAFERMFGEAVVGLRAHEAWCGAIQERLDRADAELRASAAAILTEGR